MLQHQRIAHHHAHQARIALTKLQQQRHHARCLVGAALGGLRGIGRVAPDNLRHPREHGLLDEIDQPLEHLGLAGEVAVQGCLAYRQARGQRRRGDALGPGLLQHLGQCLQDLHAPLAGLGPLARRWAVAHIGSGDWLGDGQKFRHAGGEEWKH